MIKELRNLAVTFLEFDSWNLFNRLLEAGNFNKARLLIEDRQEELLSQLESSFINESHDVVILQLKNVKYVDSILTSFIIDKAVEEASFKETKDASR